MEALKDLVILAKVRSLDRVYIRGNVIVGEDCVLGNSCEFKNAIILEGAQIPHFSYVGDSIIGENAHLGAGVICSNLRLDQRSIKICELNNEQSIRE